MSAFAIACVSMVAAALVTVLATGVALALRIKRLQQHATTLQHHPTVTALRALAGVQNRLRDLSRTLDEIKSRCRRIGEETAEVAAASALLRLQVERVSFATRLLLDTLVPTLRGSLAD